MVGNIVREHLEIVPGRHWVALPAGAYRVELGLYRAQTSERLPIIDANRNALDDHVTLPVEVGR